MVFWYIYLKKCKDSKVIGLCNLNDYLRNIKSNMWNTVSENNLNVMDSVFLSCSEWQKHWVSFLSPWFIPPQARIVKSPATAQSCTMEPPIGVEGVLARCRQSTQGTVPASVLLPVATFLANRGQHSRCHHCVVVELIMAVYLYIIYIILTID